MTAFRRFYGEGPVHLLVTAACIAAVGYVVLVLAPDPSAPWILLWFLGAVLAHDLVLFPAYAAADRLLTSRRAGPATARISAVNHVRIPAMGSGLLLLIFLPSISRHSAGAFTGTSGQTLDAALPNWWAITALLAAGSAVLYIVRVALHRRRPTAVRDRGD